MTKSRGIGRGKRGGRPRAITPAKHKILRLCFEKCMNKKDSCSAAKITTQTFDNECHRNPKFFDEMEDAKRIPVIQAHQTIFDAMKKGDAATARWFLSKVRKEEFGDSMRYDSDMPIGLPQEMTIILPGSKPHPRIVPE